MRRKLMINWGKAHERLREALADGIDDSRQVGVTEKGWSYVTFVTSNCGAEEVLYDVDQLDLTAQENGYYLPREMVTQHSKVIISAKATDNEPSVALFGLVKFLEEFERRFDNGDEFPQHGFYGKIGGEFDRPEKGRVLVMYGQGEDALAEIFDSAVVMSDEFRVPGVRFDVDLSNSLSEIPRLLDGFDDPDYLKSGATHFRITDPHRFKRVLEDVRLDQPNYLFYRDQM